MKITKRQLRQIIISETRDIHIQGIRNKLANLEAALSQQKLGLSRLETQAEELEAESPHDPYAGMDLRSYYGDPIRNQIWRIEEKIDLLTQQLEALEGAEGGAVADLPRGYRG